MVKQASRRASRETTTADDLKRLLAEAERVLSHPPANPSDEVRELRARLAQVVSASRFSLQRIREEARHQMERADDVVRSHPYPSLGLAVGCAAAAGFLMARRAYR